MDEGRSLMTRAYVLVGVSMIGGLEPLRAVASALDSMELWALSQTDRSHVTVLKDVDGGEVTTSDIFDAIDRFVSDPEVDHLCVYFSGHGILQHNSEFWLLSRCARNMSEAVNLASTVRTAMYGRVPHVVFISDACRSLAPDLGLASVSGSDVYPRDDVSRRAQKVDQFFATLQGEAAVEIHMADRADFEAVYTTVLSEALHGRPASFAEPEIGDPPGRVVRARPIRDGLDEVIAAYLDRRRAPLTISLHSDAVVTSDPDDYLSRIPPDDESDGGGESDPILDADVGRRALAPSPVAEAGRVLDRALDGRPIADMTEFAMENPSPHLRLHARIAFNAERDLNLDLPPVGWGRGPRSVRVTGERLASVDILGDRTEPNLRFVDTTVESFTWSPRRSSDPPTLCMLTFASGDGLLVPLFSSYDLSLDLRDGRLRSLSFEHERASDEYLRDDFARTRELRTLVGSMTEMGVFRPSDDQLARLARKIRPFKSYDPSLAIYAAYAYAARGDTDSILEMSEFLVPDLSGSLFDLQMLGSVAGAQDPSFRRPSLRLATPYPMLAQGWSLLDAYSALSPFLEELLRTVRPGLWTLFDPTGVGLLRENLSLFGQGDTA